MGNTSKENNCNMEIIASFFFGRLFSKARIQFPLIVTIDFERFQILADHLVSAEIVYLCKMVEVSFIHVFVLVHSFKFDINRFHHHLTVNSDNPESFQCQALKPK